MSIKFAFHDTVILSGHRQFGKHYLRLSPAIVIFKLISGDLKVRTFGSIWMTSPLLRQPNYLSSVAQKSIFYNGLYEFNCLPNKLEIVEFSIKV
jgi:hypothetical protein